ncbi:MAG: response regulator [Candidatus Margulisbacteria bacterium]|nr:response regulator [Candidatus Margulisiibacteriota bacterium]
MAKKILIIEDYPATTEMIENILKTEGFQVITAPDGPAGLKQARSGKPDLILLDIMMPEMSGFEVLEKLKAERETAKIPVIIISVRASEENIAQGKELGAIEYMSKPFDPFKLVEIVKTHLGL